MNPISIKRPSVAAALDVSGDTVIYNIDLVPSQAFKVDIPTSAEFMCVTFSGGDFWVGYDRVPNSVPGTITDGTGLEMNVIDRYVNGRSFVAFISEFPVRLAISWWTS